MEKETLQHNIQNVTKRRKKIIILTILQSRLYKMKIFYIFSQKNLHISKKSSIFAPDLKNKCLTIKYQKL